MGGLQPPEHLGDVNPNGPCDVFDFGVIDENADWIVVDKPAPLQVHPSKPGGPPTLWHGLRALLACDLVDGDHLSIINRLDRETSGLTIVAKRREAARRLHKAMMRRQIHKEYTAIVWGWPEWESLEIDAPILRRGDVMDSDIYLMQAVHPDGAACRTSCRVVRRFARQTSNGGRFSIIAATPHTGRMHQIRVHLAHAGFPLVGDKLYGPSPQWYLRQIDRGWTPEAAAALLLPRHALHSSFLALADEETVISWHAPLPPDLAEFSGGSGFVGSDAPVGASSGVRRGAPPDAAPATTGSL